MDMLLLKEILKASAQISFIVATATSIAMIVGGYFILKETYEMVGLSWTEFVLGTMIFTSVPFYFASGVAYLISRKIR